MTIGPRALGRAAAQDAAKTWAADAEPADGARIVIALRTRRPEVCGTVRLEEAPPGTFTGWLGLLSALHDAIEAAK